MLEELAREQDEAATDSLADAIETLRSADPDNPWLPPALVMCAYYLSDDDAATAIELCERAAATAREQGELQAELAALDALSWSQANLGRFDDAIETLQNGVRLSRDTAPDWASMLGGSLSWYLWSQGRYPAAVEAARAAMHYIRRPQVAWERTAWLAESLAEALISLGDWDEAKRVLDDAVGVPLAGQAAVTVHCLTGLLAVRRGDVAAAREHLAVARRHTPPQEDALLSQRLPPRWLSAEIAASERDLDTVRSTLAPLWESPHPEVVSESIWRPMLLLARLEADDATLGGTRRAADPASWTALDQVTERLHRLGPTGRPGGASSRRSGHARTESTTFGRWEAVVDAWTALGQKPEQGYALARAAECHARSGDRATAVELLTAAGAIAAAGRCAPGDRGGRVVAPVAARREVFDAAPASGRQRSRRLTDPSRGRGAGPGRGGTRQRRRRAETRDLVEDRECSRVQHPGEAGSQQSHAGSQHGVAARADHDRAGGLELTGSTTPRTDAVRLYANAVSA